MAQSQTKSRKLASPQYNKESLIRPGDGKDTFLMHLKWSFVISKSNKIKCKLSYYMDINR